MNERDLVGTPFGATIGEAVRVKEHTRKPATTRGSPSEPAKAATSATAALKREPESDDEKYANSLAGVLLRFLSAPRALAVSQRLCVLLGGSP